MYKYVLPVIALAAISLPAQANDIFSRIDKALSTAERAMDTTDSTLNRTDRLGDRASKKIPTSRRDNAKNDQAASENLSAAEAETLRRAEEIEERRILREAEAIRQKRGY